jgi:hypothetical protein
MGQKGIIEAISNPKEFMGKMQMGFKLGGVWYNIAGEEGQLLELKDTIMQKGNEIDFIDDGFKMAKNIKLIAKAERQEKSWAEDMINLEKLLDSAHLKGLQKVEIIKRETKFDEKNIPIQSISEVRVTMKDGSIFEGTGDADINNVTDMTEDAIIRMGETRGLVRALRWATNESKAATEEKK